MFNIFNKFIYWFLSLQEGILTKKLERKLKKSFSHTTSKTVFSEGNSLKLSTKTEKNKEKLKKDVGDILKACQNDSKMLLEFVEKNGTAVYKIPFANKLLQVINYDEGLISELKGLKALYLSFVLSVFSKSGFCLALSTQPMFVLRDLPLDNYCMIQQFHKWYAIKLDMPGFDNNSQENFQKFLYSSCDEDIKLLSLEEIIGLKEAIARDVEAINFVVDLAKSTTGSKNALKKLTTGGASI